jgi:hypothetical protein
LETAYGPQSRGSVESCHAGLKRVAAALCKDDVALAGIEALMLRLPEISPISLSRLEDLEDLRKAGTAWQSQPRVPVGEPDGGQWTSDSESTSRGSQSTSDGGRPASDAGEEGQVNPATVEEVANRDYHDEVVEKIARIVRRLGCRAETEVELVALDGLSTRADILMMTPDGELFLIEVKTGVGPKYEDAQRLIYPMAMLGKHVFSPDPRIAEFGFAPGELLPPMGFDVAYKRDRKTRLQIISPGGQIIAESK